MQHQQTKRYARLEARVTTDQKKLIEYAAQLRGTSVTDFIITTMQDVATEAIKNYETMTLQDEDRKVFLDAILKPLEPNKALKTAVTKYKKKQGF